MWYWIIWRDLSCNPGRKGIRMQPTQTKVIYKRIKEDLREYTKDILGNRRKIRTRACRRAEMQCKSGVLINIHIDLVKCMCGFLTNHLRHRCASICSNVIVCATIIKCVMVFKTWLAVKSRVSAANTTVYVWNRLQRIRELITHPGLMWGCSSPPSHTHIEKWGCSSPPAPHPYLHPCSC